MENNISKEQTGMPATETKNDKQEKDGQVYKDPRKAAPKKDLRIEDNLEIHNLKGKEKRKARRERLKEYTADMTKKEKAEYYIYYYKWKALIAVIAIIAIVSLSVTIYRQNKPVAISYALVNCDTYTTDTSVFENDYMKYYGFGRKYQIRSTYPIRYNLDTFEEDYAKNPNDAGFTSFPILCNNNYYDVIVTDLTGLRYCGQTSLVHPLTACLTPDLDKSFREKYPDRIIQVENYNGDLTEYAIDISGTAFAEKLNPGYEDVYLCFPGTAPENITNIRRLLNYIFQLGLDV